MEKQCKRCGKIYAAERNLSQYCSPTCRQYAYLERKGLKMNSGETNSSMQEQNAPKQESKTENNSVNLQSTQESKQNRTDKERIENNNQPVNSVNNISPEQLGELMQQIKELKEQVAKNGQPAPNNQEKSFQQLLDERLSEMGGANLFTKEHFFQWNYSDFMKVNYVNERLKSYLTQLLKFHKEGQAECRHLKSICEKMGDLMGSFDYRHLPDDYPYKKDVADFSNRIKNIINACDEDDEIEFRIRKSVRVEMNAIIIEIGNTVPDVDHCPRPKDPKDFSQNSYYLAAKKRGFDILKDY